MLVYRMLEGYDNAGYNKYTNDDTATTDIDEDSFLSDLERNSARSSLCDSAREETQHSRRHDMLQAITERQVGLKIRDSWGVSGTLTGAAWVILTL